MVVDRQRQCMRTAKATRDFCCCSTLKSNRCFSEVTKQSFYEYLLRLVAKRVHFCLQEKSKRKRGVFASGFVIIICVNAKRQRQLTRKRVFRILLVVV